MVGGLGPFSDPPPLLSVPSGALPVSMQPVTVPGVFPPQATPLPYFMAGGGGAPHELHVQARAKLEGQAQSLVHAHGMMVKREPEEDGSLRVPTSKPGEDAGGREGSVTFPHYPPVSPSGVGNLSASATAAAAAAHYAAAATAFPSRPGGFDPYPPSNAWQRSPISSHSSGDEASDEPLQLTVHKRSSEDDSRDADSGQEGPGGDSGSSSRNSNGAGSPQHHQLSSSLLPVKLRHKMPPEMSPPHHGGAAFPAALGLGGPPPFVNGLAQLSEIALAQQQQASPLSLVKKDGGVGVRGNSRAALSGDLKHLDPKYLERRRRNNEAARKCRENRKNLTRLREAKSEYLESENSKLRTELESLQEEMKQLRELLDKKRLEQGLSQDGLQRQADLPEEQQRRLEQLEHEHRLLEQEQQRLERRREQHQQDMLNDDLDDLDDSGKDAD